MSDAAHSGKAALIAFGQALLEGDDYIEGGETWSAETGWRVYLRTGPKVLMMSAKSARKMAEVYIKAGGRKMPDIAVVIDVLLESAEVVKRKNRDRVVPEQAAEMLPTRGIA